MPPDRIIIVTDPVGRLLFHVRQRRPWAGVDQLFLVSREERFRYGIIVADSCPSQRPPDSILRAGRPGRLTFSTSDRAVPAWNNPPGRGMSPGSLPDPARGLMTMPGRTRSAVREGAGWQTKSQPSTGTGPENAERSHAGRHPATPRQRSPERDAAQVPQAAARRPRRRYPGPAAGRAPTWRDG
jgi:hypothetical protein